MLQCDASLPGVSSSNPSFSKAGATFTMPMPGQSAGATLSLDNMAGTYNPASHSEWPQGNQSQTGYSSSCLKQESLSIPHQEQTVSLQTSTSSLLQHPAVYKTEKTIDFNFVKQEQKGAGGGGVGKHQPPPQSAYPPPVHPPPPQPSPAQKLSLDKYREKHATELAVSGEKRRQEPHGGVMDCDVKGEISSSSSSTYAPLSMSQVDHRKHSQPHQTPHGGGGGGSNTASPMKLKVPSSSASAQDRRHQSDKRDKGSLKLRLAVPGSGGSSQLDKSGQQSKDELKMKIKVASSEHHSSSDEGIAANNNNKSKHSSPLVGKEKHRGAEHNLHRHHKHSHPHTHSGNGGGGSLLRGPPGLVSMEGTTLGPPGSTSLSSSSSRKRAYPDASHNHHPSSSSSTSCSKVSKISKVGPGAAGTSSFSSPCFPLCSSAVLQCVSSGLQLFG